MGAGVCDIASVAGCASAVRLCGAAQTFGRENLSDDQRHPQALKPSQCLAEDCEGEEHTQDRLEIADHGGASRADESLTCKEREGTIVNMKATPKKAPQPAGVTDNTTDCVSNSGTASTTAAATNI